MKILAIDGNSIMNRAFYGIKLLSTKNGEYTNAIFGYMNILLSLLEETKPDSVICAFDLKSPTFRHKMYEDYKAGRKGMPDELALQMPVMKEILTCMGYKIVEVEGYEADDILGTVAKISSENGNSCVIATGDRDSLQLIDKNVNVRLATTKMGKSEHQIYDDEAVFEKYGVYPKDLITVKALMGDSSDNIPGVKGIGEKTAVALVAKFKTLDNLYANIDDKDIKKGVREKLLADKDNAYLSEKLGTIFCDVPMDKDLSHYTPENQDYKRLYEILSRLEMHSLIKRLNLKENIAENNLSQAVNEQENFDISLTELDTVNKLNLKNNKEIFLHLIWDKNILKYADIMQENKIYSLSVANEKDFFEYISPYNEKIIVHGAKPLYKKYFEYNIDFKICLFDTEIAAYILNSSSSDYPEENVFSEYGCSAVLDNPVKSYAANLQKLKNILNIKLENENSLPLMYDIEMPLTKVLASMEYIGVKIDKKGLLDYGEELKLKITSLESEIYDLAGEEFNINSPKQLGVILFEKLDLPHKKKTKTGYSTGAEILEELVDKHPIIVKVLEYRKLAKLNSTYVDSFLKLADKNDRIHSNFKQTETKTGRISSTEPNMQNIPVRTEEGAVLRKFFISEDKTTLVDADYSQIELRVLAHMANDKNMMKSFINGDDIHLNTAAQVFDMPPIFVTPLMRTRAKAVNFGIIYGMGAFSLSKDIDVSVAEADKYIKNYLATYSGVKDFMDKQKSFASEKGYVSTVYGRRRYIPELKSSNRNIKNFGERAAMNMPIQGTAADIIKIAMVKVYDALEKSNLGAKLILQIHDELIVECPEENARAVKELLKTEMENAVKLNVPLIADANIGKTWFDAK